MNKRTEKDVATHYYLDTLKAVNKQYQQYLDLSDQCSFLVYDSIDSLAETRYLSHMSDSIIGEYEDSAEV